MKVPVSWLREYVDFELTPEELAARLTMGGLEVEGIEPSVDGPVLDVYITPNRGDCLSILGVAREISALIGSPLKWSPVIGIDRVDAPVPNITVVAPDHCPRYAAQIVTGITIGASPDWLVKKLEAAGQRSVNNIVDVTNYVMLELGQPLHAFDLDKLSGMRIVVRKAQDGETITTLDGENRTLNSDILVIADADRPIAVAGIMGGADTEVTSQTRTILLESAHFSPLSVRRASRSLALRSEASYRFERVVDPLGVVVAINRACQLLVQIGQPAPSSAIADIYPTPTPDRQINLRVSRAAGRLGMPITSQICTETLSALGFDVLEELPLELLRVTVPQRRADIAIEEDLIEEVGRIYGYENIPETLPTGETTRGGDSEAGKFISRLKRILVESGLQEVVTHSLTAPSFLDGTTTNGVGSRVEIRNALSANVSGLRGSLIPTMLDVAQNNSVRGQQNVALFEVGRVWQNELSSDGEVSPVEYLSVACLLAGSHLAADWRGAAGRKSEPATYLTMKGIVDRLLEKLAISDYTLRSLAERDTTGKEFHPGRSATISLGGGRTDGIIGELHPEQAARLDLRNRIYLFEISLSALVNAGSSDDRRYQPISRQQAISRDIAPRISETTSYAAVTAAIEAAAIPILASHRLTDLYRGEPLPEGSKSFTIALSFSYRPASATDDRALTDVEVGEAITKIREELQTRCGATFAG